MDYAQARAALQPGGGLLSPVQASPVAQPGPPVQMEGGRAPQLNVFGPLPNSTVGRARGGRRGALRTGRRRPKPPRSAAERLKRLGKLYADTHQTPLVNEALDPFKAKLVGELETALGAQHVASYKRGKSARAARAFRAKMKRAAQAKAEEVATAAIDANAGLAADKDMYKEDAKARVTGTKDAAGKAIKELAKDGAAEASGSVATALGAAGKASFCKHPEWGEPERYTVQKRVSAAQDGIKKAAKAKFPKARQAANDWKAEVLAGNKEDDANEKIAAATEGLGDDAAAGTAAAAGMISEAVLEAAIAGAVLETEKKLTSYLSGKLGKGGVRKAFRSQQVFEFRKSMKEAARAKAYADVNTEVESGHELDGSGAATKSYVKVNAKKHAYAKAKASVDTAITSIAQDGAKTAIKNASVDAKLKKAARAAGMKALRSHSGPPAKALAAAKSAAKAAANGAVSSVYPSAQRQAHGWKNTLLEKEQASRAGLTGTMGQLHTSATDATETHAATKDAAKTRGKSQVVKDEVGKKSVKASLAANTTAQGMGMIGRICDLTVPSRGDACKLEIELKIPVPSSPAFVLLRVVGEAQRGVTNRKNEGPDATPDNKSLAFQCEIAFGGGVSLWGLELNGALGFLVRSQAMDTHKAMNAITYAGYRAACGINGDMGNWWAGARSGAKDRQARAASPHDSGNPLSAMGEAELWAAMLEEQVFMKPGAAPGQMVMDEDAFADVGGSLTGKGKLKAGVAEGETAMRAELFRRYDAEQIRKVLTEGTAAGTTLAAQHGQVDVGKAGSSQANAEARRKLIRGKTSTQFIWETKLKCKVAGQTVEFAGQLTAGTGGWEISVGSMLILDTGGKPTDFESIAIGIVGASVSIGKTLGGLYQNHKKDGKTQGYHAAGAALDIGNDVEGIVNAGMGNSLGKSLADAYKVGTSRSDQVNQTTTDAMGDAFGTSKDMPANEATKAGATSEFGLKLALTFGSGGVSLELSQVKVRKLAIDIGTAGLDINLERAKRLAKLGYEDGHFVGEALGFGTSHGA